MINLAEKCWFQPSGQGKTGISCGKSGQTGGARKVETPIAAGGHTDILGEHTVEVVGISIAHGQGDAGNGEIGGNQECLRLPEPPPEHILFWRITGLLLEDMSEVIDTDMECVGDILKGKVFGVMGIDVSLDPFGNQVALADAHGILLGTPPAENHQNRADEPGGEVVAGFHGVHRVFRQEVKDGD